LSQHLKADLLLAFCTLIWGATFVIVKDALVDASDFVFLALRFLVAAAVLALIYRREISPLRVPGFRARPLAAGVLMGSLLFGGFALQTAGLRFTSPSKAAFITGFSVVLVPVFLGLAGGARLNIWVWAGAFAALAGLYCLTVPSAGEFARLNRGDLLVLCAAVLFALHIISVGAFTPHHSPGALSLIQVLTMALLTLIAAPAFALTGWQPARVNPTPQLVGAVLATGVLATALAFSAQIWAQQHASSSHTAILFSLEPVFAAITSFVFLHERLGGRALAGAALIFAGILLVELREPTKPAAPESPGSVIEPAE
jgi:drug/metabolite transporter (DMT)-like permease